MHLKSGYSFPLQAKKRLFFSEQAISCKIHFVASTRIIEQDCLIHQTLEIIQGPLYALLNNVCDITHPAKILLFLSPCCLNCSVY